MEDIPAFLGPAADSDEDRLTYKSSGSGLGSRAWGGGRPVTNLLFRVPETIRSANRDTYRPRIFHFSPYAPNFLLKYIPDLHGDVARSPFSASTDQCLKEIMLEDLVDAEFLEALVDRMFEDWNKLWEILRHMYPERPLIMDTVPAANLAHLFASSAAIIVSSFIFYTSSDDLTVHMKDRQWPIIRHAFVYRYYAIMDAIIPMDNQIPILLLKFVCDALYEMECSRFVIRYGEGHEETETTTDMDATVLLVYILRRALKFVSPFHGAQSIWEPEEVEETKSWIKLNPLKPLIAYIYDTLVVRQSAEANGAKNDVAAGSSTPEETKSWIKRNPLKPLIAYIYDSLVVRQSAGANGAKNDVAAGSSTPDSGDSWGWELPCRMVSASLLRSWGVQFRADNRGSCFEGIEFDEKTTTLTLPVITLQDHTIPFLCNLMAYELTTRLKTESNLQDVGSFVLFLDYLIDKEEDVQVLAEAGVLRSYTAISNANIAEMFDRLVDGMIVDLTPKHSHIVQQLQRSCGRRWGQWSASLKEKYWEKQPWLLISVAAATVLLVLTVLQTVYSMKQAI